MPDESTYGTADESTHRPVGDDSTVPTVAVVTHPLGPSGENAARTLLDVLSVVTTVSLITAALPADSAVWTDYDVTEVTDEGVDPANVGTTAYRFCRNQVRFCRALAASDADVVLFFGATAYLLPVVYARLLGKTVVLEPRGDVPLTLRYNWEETLPDVLARGLAAVVAALERVDYHLANAIVTYTPAMASELGLDAFEEKLYPDGARYVDGYRYTLCRPFAERDRVVGFVGRLDEEKNVRTVVRAASRLPEDVTFRFVGGGSLSEAVRAVAGSDPTVELTGWVDHDQVAAELNAMRLLVLPSRPTEGLPTAVLESLACGTPVLATPVSGVPDVVRDGETGFHLPRGRLSPEVLADRILSAVHDPDLATISASGADLVDDHYRFEHAVERYAAILSAVGARGSSG